MSPGPVSPPGVEPALSVVLCTHDPRADYLRRALDALRAQRLDPVRWELLLVDNASATPLAGRWDLAWHPRGRHVREDELGLTAARLRGIRESSGALLVFVDDDNVLAPDFLEQAVAIAAAHPHVGVFGSGSLEPEFEVEPPPAVRSRLGMLALRTVPRPIWTNNPLDDDAIPWGAGLVVHRAVAERWREMVGQVAVRAAVGRRGSNLFGGEDDLFSWTAAEGGLGFGLFPQLRVTHLISAGRLTPRHFVKLVQGHSFSHGVLRALLGQPEPRKGAAARAARIVAQGLRNGWFGVRCQLAAHRGQDAAARFVAERRVLPLEGRGAAAPGGAPAARSRGA